MRLPNFLIIGAAKSGTTAVHSFLRQHPQVFVSENKEPRYFAYAGQTLDSNHPVHRTTVTRLEDYLKLFESAGNAIAVGEASPSYLHNVAAPPRIKEMIPEVKLIAILRHPADRAFSHFMHFIKHNIETAVDFKEALDAVEALDYNGWIPRRDYMSFGFYGQQLQRYYELFDREQIKVYIYEEYRQSPSETLADLFRFIGVDPEYTVDTKLEINVSGKPRNRALLRWLSEPSSARRLLGRAMPVKARRRIMSTLQTANLKRATLSADHRRSLTKEYQQDIQLLEHLLQRKIDCWSA